MSAPGSTTSSSSSSSSASKGDDGTEVKATAVAEKTQISCVQVPVIYWETVKVKVNSRGEAKPRILLRKDFTLVWPGDIASATIGDLLSSIADCVQVPRKDLIFSRSGKDQDPGISLAKFHAQCTTMCVERRFRICKWCGGKGMERCTE